MPITLYSVKTNFDHFTITKFDSDYNPFEEKGRVVTYDLSLRECSCPAASRPTCKHRRMLNDYFLPNAHVNDGFFLEWETRIWRKPIQPATEEPENSVEVALAVEPPPLPAPARASIKRRHVK